MNAQHNEAVRLGHVCRADLDRAAALAREGQGFKIEGCSTSAARQIAEKMGDQVTHHNPDTWCCGHQIGATWETANGGVLVAGTSAITFHRRRSEFFAPLHH